MIQSRIDRPEKGKVYNDDNAIYTHTVYITSLEEDIESLKISIENSIKNGYEIIKNK